MRAVVLLVAAGLAGLLQTATAQADDLTTAEAELLRSGHTVSRPQALFRGDRRYVGGVTYTIVSADPREVAALLSQVEAWRRILPNTRSARTVGAAGDDRLVEVTHGSALIQVTYTMRLHRDEQGVRFWMDAARPHDIEDVWGFFRAEPIAGKKTLVTYGILIDMGPGLLRDLFEDHVREAALSVPDRVRGLLLERSAARHERLVAGSGVPY
jgi:Polyketide cyclase / dehydrase and lipid transport